MKTFKEFWNSNNINSIFVVTVGIPNGLILTHNIGENVSDENYCDLSELLSESQFDCLWDLSGDVESNKWNWNGLGNPSYLSNTILKITAWSNKK